MFDRLWYFASTFAEAGLAVFGIHGLYEQPAYAKRADLGAGLEIRDYPAATAIEATATGARRDQASSSAFRLLFAYITGANTTAQTIAMTVPVQQSPVLIPMTAPVRTDAIEETGTTRVTMRFFLPAKLAPSPPLPLDPRVKLTTMPAMTVAALRFGGNATPQAHARKEAELLGRLATTAWQAAGMPYLLNYDPPFTIPFLKRNEIAVTVVPRGEAQ